MRSSWKAGILLVLISSLWVRAEASEFCDKMFNGFADEMDQIARSYDRMADDRKSLKEVCDYSRGTAIPARKRILATAQANQSKCENGAAAVKFARDTLQKAVSDFDRQCGAAGR